MKRLTSRDYLKKHDDFTEKLCALDANVATRLIELAKIYPDAVPLISPDLNEDKTLSKWVLNYFIDHPFDGLKSIPIKARINYIDRIEKWAEEQHPHKQLKIDF